MSRTISDAAVAMTSPYLTTAQAAEYLGYRSPDAIYSAVRRGLLKPGRRGARGAYLFLREDLDAFLRASVEPERSARGVPQPHTLPPRSRSRDVEGRRATEEALDKLRELTKARSKASRGGS